MTDSQQTEFFVTGMASSFELISTKGSVDPTKPILDSNILNLSKKVLNKNETTLLNKGLNFILTPEIIQPEELVNSTRDIGRRIKIAHYFQDDLRSKFRHIPKFKKRSTWSPPDNQILGAIKEKITKVESEIKSLKILKENPNLTKYELRALQQLKKDTNHWTSR